MKNSLLPFGPNRGDSIVPLTFTDPADYDRIEAHDDLSIAGLTDAIKNAQTLTVRNQTKNFDFTCTLTLTPRQRDLLLAGGLLNHTRQHATT